MSKKDKDIVEEVVEETPEVVEEVAEEVKEEVVEETTETVEEPEIKPATFLNGDKVRFVPGFELHIGDEILPGDVVFCVAQSLGNDRYVVIGPNGAMVKVNGAYLEKV